MSVHGQYVASLFAEDDRQDRLDNYIVVQVKINYHLNPNLGLFFGVDNLLDEDYLIYADLPGGSAGVYAMPGRAVTGGISFNFQKK